MRCVYMIQNTVNSKIYIGSTIEYEKRVRSHKNGLEGNYHDNRRLQEDYDLYGKRVFAYIPLCEEDDDEKRFSLEADIIQKLRTYENGYNLSVDGRGRYVISEETREKMSQNSLGENNPFYKKSHTEETRRKLSEQAKKRTGNKNPFYGKAHSQESINKMTESYKNLIESGWVNPQQGVPKTEKSKRNNALAQPSRRPVHAKGKNYMSISECAKDLGVVNATVRNRINSEKFPDYYFIDS